METVRKYGQHGDGIDNDYLDDGVPLRNVGVDIGGVGDSFQSV